MKIIAETKDYIIVDNSFTKDVDGNQRFHKVHEKRYKYCIKCNKQHLFPYWSYQVCKSCFTKWEKGGCKKDLTKSHFNEEIKGYAFLDDEEEENEPCLSTCNKFPCDGCNPNYIWN